MCTCIMVPSSIHDSLETELMNFTLLLLPVVLILVSSFFLYKLKHYAKKKNSSLLLLPSPPKLPLIGNLHQLGTHPYRSLRSMSERYGEMMWVQLGSIPTLIISSARAAREIMKTHDAIFTNRATTRASIRLLNNCKDVGGAPYGEYWRQMKSICVLHLLNSKTVRSFRRVRDEETALLMKEIVRVQEKSSSVNLSNMFSSYVISIICRVAFGRKYSSDQNDTFHSLVKEFMMLIGCITVGDCIPWLAWISEVNGWNAKVEKVANEFGRFMEEVIEEHKKDGLDHIELKENKDLVDVLLEIQKNHSKTDQFFLDTESMIGLLLDMFSAGTDTSVAVLEWAMTELLRHPKILKELQEEVRGISRDKVDVSEDDLEHMKYLKAVIKETLRLHPPVAVIPRKSTDNVKINGYEIPAKTSVLINTWAIHRDPTSWNEPDKFNPDRFLSSAVDFRGHDFELIPFGSGRRRCPGILFSTANNELVLANLIHKFDWSLPGEAKCENLDMRESIGLTVRRKTPLIAIARARN